MSIYDEARNRGISPEDYLYECEVTNRGAKAAKEIAAIFDRCPPKVPLEQAWKWAASKYEEQLRAEDAGTGYDPEDEHRRLDWR